MHGMKRGGFNNGGGGTRCPRISDPVYIVTHYIRCVTTSWTHSK